MDLSGGINFLKKNIFLIAFFVVSFGYAYFNYNNDDTLTFYLKPLIVATLLLQYITVKRKQNLFFIIALVFALFGDVFFNFNSETSHIIAMASFLMFLLFLMIVISYAAKEIKFNKLLFSTFPFLMLLFMISYFFFDFKNVMSGIYLVLAIVISVLCSFSFYFYLKDRSKKSLYFFIGCMLFIMASFSRMMNEFYGFSDIVKLINNSSYILSLFFFYLGSITSLIDKNRLKSDTF